MVFTDDRRCSFSM